MVHSSPLGARHCGCIRLKTRTSASTSDGNCRTSSSSSNKLGQDNGATVALVLYRKPERPKSEDKRPALQLPRQILPLPLLVDEPDGDEADDDDVFEAYRTSELPEFRGARGLYNMDVRQTDQGPLSVVYDFYTVMMKQPLPEFASAMLAAPVLLSALFTLLYLPGFRGLALDRTSEALEDLSWYHLFEIFMFSLSLCTGLEPEVAPVSPYTLVLANINALVAQLLFVFLSGAVFARLSQPSQPIKSSEVAVISYTKSGRKRFRILMARFVLAGPQPCELIDVKVELTFKYNALTSSGTYFRSSQPLKLVRRESFYVNHGMLVRHIIDEQSPLFKRTQDMLEKEDAVVSLSVVGLERSSMQSVFQVQHYCACDGQIIWDAEFEDIILINKKNTRIVDHSRLSSWRYL